MAIEAGVLDKELTLNGLRFHYGDWGNTHAQTLICLHGFTSHAHSWDTFAEAMRDRYHVLALDQRGHGETDWATDYHADRRVEDLEAFVERLGLSQFVLLGLSMGGRVAFQYASRHPAQVERLVIVDIAPEVDSRGGSRIQDGLKARDVFDDPEEAFQQARAANPRPPDNELRQRVTHGLKQLNDGRWTYRYDVKLRDGSGARVMPSPAEIEEAWSALANISCPTLLVRGSDSDILGRELAARMVRSIPNCRLVEVANSGHSVPLDNPAGFLAAVNTFL